MPILSILRAVARIGLAVTVVTAGLSLSAPDAEAKRIRVKSSDSASSGASSGSSHKAHDTDSASASTGGPSITPRLRSRSEETKEKPATGQPETSAPVAPKARKVKAAAPKDLDVPGCPTGMMCSVCVAGCSAPAGSIVHAQPRATRVN